MAVRNRVRSGFILLVVAGVIASLMMRGEVFVEANKKDRGNVLFWHIESSTVMIITIKIVSSTKGTKSYDKTEIKSSGSVIVSPNEVVDASISAEVKDNSVDRGRVMCDIRTRNTVVDHDARQIVEGMIFRGVYCSGTVKGVEM